VESIINYENYVCFLNNPSPNTYFTGVKKYLLEKIYNHDLVDIAPLIFSNVLKANLSILNEKTIGTVEVIEVETFQKSDISLAIHRKNDHFNGIRSVPKMQQQTHIPSEAFRRYTYDSKSLRSMQVNPLAKTISRKIRKRLFQLKLWKPRQDWRKPSFIKIPNVLRSSANATLLRIGMQNCRSVRNKCTTVSEYVLDKDLDVFCLTETWLSNYDAIDVSDLCPQGYSFINYPRDNGKGGGIGIIHRSGLVIKQTKLHLKDYYRTFEFGTVTIVGTVSCLLVVVYRPPPSERNGLKECEFLLEFEDFLGVLATVTDSLLIVGDFNVHVDDMSKPGVCRFIEQVKAADLIQHVKGATHKGGHTLDLVMSRVTESLVQTVYVMNDFISDHSAIICELKLRPELTTEGVKYTRKLKSMETEKFKCGLESLVASASDGETNKSVNELADVYQEGIKSILDKVAPLLKVRTKGQRPKPWYNDTIHEARLIRRTKERKWKKTRSEVDRQIFLDERKRVVRLIDTAKVTFYKEKLARTKPCDLFRVVNSILSSSQCPLPSGVEDSILCETFSEFFFSKVRKIRNSLKITDNTIKNDESFIPAHSDSFCQFKLMSQDSVEKVVTNLANKSCSLDPAPTWLLRENLPTVLPLMVSIVNTSLKEGKYPDDLKHALVRPLIKKQTLCKDEISNYRPVSNLSFIGKVLEKVVSTQLVEYMSNNHLHDPMQSAYKSGHSCETAMLKVTNDINKSLDSGQCVLLSMLDLSAAFDLVDHEILYSRFQKELNISGQVLQWFVSYLTARTQSVAIGNSISKPVELTTGVPQGSVLGPLLYSIYVLPLKRIFQKHGISYHIYADDTQIYVVFNPKEDNALEIATGKLEKCVTDVKHWMNHNKLKLNDNKTEFILFASSNNYKKYGFSQCSMRVGDQVIKVATQARNLGSILDSHLSMEASVNSTVRSLYGQMRKLYKLRQYLDQTECARVVNSLITSRLDYNNSLLYGVPKTLIHRLQVAQNQAARLITGIGPFEHITPVLMSLHWLPVEWRIKYKILVFVFKCLNTESAPSYLSDLLRLYVPGRSLRSSSDGTILVELISRNKHGMRAFVNCAPSLWNKLPYELRHCSSLNCFKQKLKTHFFKECFSA
jgi:hypothetical protein